MNKAMNHLEDAKRIYDMIARGELIDAFEKYYHDDVVMVEATGEERKGKEANRKFQKEFLGMIKEVHGTGVNTVAVNDKGDKTIVESWMDVTMNDGHRSKMEEVAVQKWQGDKIIHERFYYNMPQQAQQDELVSQSDSGKAKTR
jgi:ketosteroid isomerase-like protein